MEGAFGTINFTGTGVLCLSERDAVGAADSVRRTWSQGVPRT